jgi:hypothetical protein
MPGAMTNDELIATRTQGRWSDLFVTISKPAVIFSARINQVFDSLDGVVEISYDGAVGNLADVLPGMTLKIGSSAEKSDVGLARIRKAPTSSTIYINQTSELNLENNLYLTVVQDVGLWSRLPVGTGATMYMDYDIEFNVEIANSPMPLLGPMVTVLRRLDGTVTHTPTASAWSPIGAIIASYEWHAPGASFTANMNTANPMIDYHAAGEYLIYCIITDKNGAQSIGYRIVFVDPPTATVTFGSLEMDVDAGGWSFEFTGMSGIGPDELDDRSLVVSWVVDHIGSDELILGRLPGAENILFVGWVDGLTIKWGTKFTTVDFTAYGPAWLLNKIGGAAVSLINTDSAATTWGEVQDLTVDQALYRLVHWHSTISSIMDVYLTGDTKIVPFANLAGGMLWEQLKNYAEQSLVAFPQVDEYGRLFIEIPASLLSDIERAALPVLLDLSNADWTGQVSIDRRDIREKGMIEIGGIETGGATTLYSRAPGNISGRFGGTDAPYSTLVFANQADCNRLTGAYRAWKNNEFPSIDIQLKYDLRHLALCPRSILRLNMASSDNPLGISWTNKRLVPIALNRTYTEKSGKLLISVTCEAETSGAPGVAYYPPATVDTNISNTFDNPAIDNVDIAPIALPQAHTWYPPTVSQIPSNIQPCSDVDVPNGPIQLTWDKPELNVTGNLSAKATCSCWIRSDIAVLYPTQLQISNVSFGSMTGHLKCYGISSSGAHLVTGTVIGNMVTFSPSVATKIAGFELVLDPDASGFVPSVFLVSGDIDITKPNNEVYMTEEGQLYCIENTGGPWDNGFGTSGCLSFVPDLAPLGGKGIFGLNGWCGFGPGFGDSISVFVEELSPYTRVYFSGIEGQMLYISLATNAWLSNTGSLGYILRKASGVAPLTSGKMSLGSSSCWNICK